MASISRQLSDTPKHTAAESNRSIFQTMGSLKKVVQVGGQQVSSPVDGGIVPGEIVELDKDVTFILILTPTPS